MFYKNFVTMQPHQQDVKFVPVPNFLPLLHAQTVHFPSSYLLQCPTPYLDFRLTTPALPEKTENNKKKFSVKM